VNLDRFVVRLLARRTDRAQIPGVSGDRDKPTSRQRRRSLRPNPASGSPRRVSSPFAIVARTWRLNDGPRSPPCRRGAPAKRETRGRADAVPPAELIGPGAGIVLLQYADDPHDLGEIENRLEGAASAATTAAQAAFDRAFEADPLTAPDIGLTEAANRTHESRTWRASHPSPRTSASTRCGGPP
jgi:hypothetical protein